MPIILIAVGGALFREGRVLECGPDNGMVDFLVSEEGAIGIINGVRV